MSYRPEGWKSCPCDSCSFKNDDVYGRYCDLSCGKWTAWQNHEAGADAMLEALVRDKPLMTPQQMVLIAPERKYPNGWLIFIPEEEK